MRTQLAAAPPSKTALLGRLALAAVFIFSGLHKSASPEDFEAILEAYYILPQTHLSLFAHLIPWLELLVGLSLAAGYEVKLSSLASLGLLASFITALLYTRWRGIPLENCGCFGDWVHLTPWQAVALDLALAGAAVSTFLYAPGPWSLDRWIAQAEEP